MPRHERPPSITIVEEKTPSQVANPTIVLGLPDTGLVGIIAAGQLVESLKLTEIGYVDSDRFQPIVVLHNGRVKNPFRIYQGDDMFVIISELPVPPSLITELAKAIVEWCQSKNAKLIVALGGTPVPNRTSIESPEAFAVEVGDTIEGIAQKAGIKLLEEGILVGPYAAVLWQCRKRNFPIVSLLAQSFSDYPDPEASAAVLEAFSKLTGKKIDVKELVEKGQEIRVKTRDLMKQTGKTMQEMGKSREYDVPPLYM
jgi:uncharacterized protein